jgi:hypothetical protein
VCVKVDGSTPVVTKIRHLSKHSIQGIGTFVNLVHPQTGSVFAYHFNLFRCPPFLRKAHAFALRLSSKQFQVYQTVVILKFCNRI